MEFNEINKVSKLCKYSKKSFKTSNIIEEIDVNSKYIKNWTLIQNTALYWFLHEFYFFSFKIYLQVDIFFFLANNNNIK